MYRQYIPQDDYFSEGLYMFDIGQNDLAGEFYSKTEDQVIASIPTILLEFESGLKVCENIVFSSLQLSVPFFHSSVYRTDSDIIHLGCKFCIFILSMIFLLCSVLGKKVLHT
jgi:hypothetical protein